MWFQTFFTMSSVGSIEITYILLLLLHIFSQLQNSMGTKMVYEWESQKNEHFDELASMMDQANLVDNFNNCFFISMMFSEKHKRNHSATWKTF